MIDSFHETMLMSKQLSIGIHTSPFDPPVTDKTDYGQWCYHQINDTAVQTLSRFMSQLLCCFRTNRALRLYFLGKGE